MTNADFKIALEVGGDAAAIKAALAEYGYPNLDAVPESDRVRVCAKALTGSRAFATGAKRAKTFAQFASEFWDSRKPKAPRPATWDEISKAAWDNLKAPRPARNNAGADDADKHD